MNPLPFRVACIVLPRCSCSGAGCRVGALKRGNYVLVGFTRGDTSRASRISSSYPPLGAAVGELMPVKCSECLKPQNFTLPVPYRPGLLFCAACGTVFIPAPPVAVAPVDLRAGVA